MVFLEYTKRFEAIMADIPPDALSLRFKFEGRPSAHSGWLRLAMFRYLNMTSEELFLWKRGCLVDDVWDIWKSEVSCVLRNPMGLRVWVELSGEFVAYPELRDTVDTAQRGSGFRGAMADSTTADA
jgi:hypothetical protein